MCILFLSCTTGEGCWPCFVPAAKLRPTNWRSRVANRASHAVSPSDLPRCSLNRDGATNASNLYPDAHHQKGGREGHRGEELFSPHRSCSPPYKGCNFAGEFCRGVDLIICQAKLLSKCTVAGQPLSHRGCFFFSSGAFWELSRAVGGQMRPGFLKENICLLIVEINGDVVFILNPHWKVQEGKWRE
ncbi:hypothetical protein BaRGS_00028879, partial [Batillaria attramentaria]